MMLLFTTSGARFACEPEEILGVLELHSAPKKAGNNLTGDQERKAHCVILIGNKTIDIALSFDAMMNAIEEYVQERDLELSKQEFPDEPGSATEPLGTAEITIMDYDDAINRVLKKKD